MTAGNGGKLAVFLLVLVVTGGLGFVLYEAGKTDDGEAPKGVVPDDPNRPVKPKKPRTPDPPVLPPELDYHMPHPPPPGAVAPVPVEGHDDLNMRHWREIADACVDMRNFMLEASVKGMPHTSDPGRGESMEQIGARWHAAAIGPPANWQGPGQPTPLQHPAFGANLIAALLAKANLPLTQAQAERIGALAKERGLLMDKSDATMDVDDGSFLLDRIVARAEIVDRFYAEAFAALTPAQSAAAMPDECRGRVHLDLLSSESIWMRAIVLLHYENDEQLTVVICRGLGNQYGLLERADELQPIVLEWLKENPPYPADAMEREGFGRISRIADSARRMVDLLRRFIDRLHLEGEAAKVIRSTPGVYVIIRN